MPDAHRTALAVEDRVDIIDLTHRYAQHIDHFELDELLDLWTDDAVFDERPVGLYHSVGRPAIRTFFENDFAVRKASIHAISNLLVTGAAADAATGVCCAQIQTELRSGQEVRASVDYVDEYRRVDGRWLFSARLVRPLGKIELGDITDSLAQKMGSAQNDPA